MVANNIIRINNRINLVAVCIGLIISIFILFIGALDWSSLHSQTITDISLFIGIVLIAMTFFGSIITGLLCDDEFYDGVINGAFLSLIILLFIGFTMAIIFFVSMGILTLVSSALSSFAPLTSQVTSTQVTSPQGNSNLFYNVLLFIIFIIAFFIAGMLGGLFGIFLKQGITKVFKKIRS